MAFMSQIAPAPLNSNLPPPTAIWPEPRVEALQRAWREGLSASQIAARLGGGLTRSAVIGKLHRLGVCGGRKPSAPRLTVAPSPPRRVEMRGSAPLQLGWPAPILEAPPNPRQRRPAIRSGPEVSARYDAPRMSVRSRRSGSRKRRFSAFLRGADGGPRLLRPPSRHRDFTASIA